MDRINAFQCCIFAVSNEISISVTFTMDFKHQSEYSTNDISIHIFAIYHGKTIHEFAFKPTGKTSKSIGKKQREKPCRWIVNISLAHNRRFVRFTKTDVMDFLLINNSMRLRWSCEREEKKKLLLWYSPDFLYFMYGIHPFFVCLPSIKLILFQYFSNFSNPQID